LVRGQTTTRRTRKRGAFNWRHPAATTESGRQDKLFQHLTTNLGYPKLREHLGSVVAIMKLSDSWADFMQKLDRLHPRYGETIPLPLEFQKDDGKGL